MKILIWVVNVPRSPEGNALSSPLPMIPSRRFTFEVEAGFPLASEHSSLSMYQGSVQCNPKMSRDRGFVGRAKGERESQGSVAVACRRHYRYASCLQQMVVHGSCLKQAVSDTCADIGEWLSASDNLSSDLPVPFILTDYNQRCMETSKPS